jgi:putative flippase GtrA
MSKKKENKVIKEEVVGKMEEKEWSYRFIRACFKLIHVNLKEKTLHLLNQIFKFVIVGGIATVLDFACLYCFKEFLHLPVLVANTLSFCISVCYNYWASTKWVFDVNKEKDSKKVFLIFILFSIMGLLLNDFIMWICYKKLAIYYMMAKVIATLIVMVFNFITRKMFLE